MKPRGPDLFSWANVPNGRYPEVPGHVFDSATSADAAATMEGLAGSLADRCEAWFKASGTLRTCEELELAAKKAGTTGKHQTISARIRTDLWLKRKCLFKIATVETTGQDVRVWDDSNLAGLARDDKGRVLYRTRPTTSGRQAVLYGWGYRPEEP